MTIPEWPFLSFGIVLMPLRLCSCLLTLVSLNLEMQKYWIETYCGYIWKQISVLDGKRISGLKIQFCTLHIMQLLLLYVVSLLCFIHKINDYWVIFVFFFFFFYVEKVIRGICCYNTISVRLLFFCTCSLFAAGWSHLTYCTPMLWTTTKYVSEIEEWSEQVKKAGYFDYEIFYGQQYLPSTNLSSIQIVMNFKLPILLTSSCPC